MLWPHTKIPVPTEAGYKLLFGMLEFSLVKYKVSITTPYPTYQLLLIFGKLYKLLLHEDKNPQMPGYTVTNFTIIIYTKLAALLSMKNYQVIILFCNQINNRNATMR